MSSMHVILFIGLSLLIPRISSQEPKFFQLADPKDLNIQFANNIVEFVSNPSNIVVLFSTKKIWNTGLSQLERETKVKFVKKVKEVPKEDELVKLLINKCRVPHFNDNIYTSTNIFANFHGCIVVIFINSTIRMSTSLVRLSEIADSNFLEHSKAKTRLPASTLNKTNGKEEQTIEANPTLEFKDESQTVFVKKVAPTYQQAKEELRMAKEELRQVEKELNREIDYADYLRDIIKDMESRINKPNAVENAAMEVERAKKMVAAKWEYYESACNSMKQAEKRGVGIEQAKEKLEIATKWLKKDEKELNEAKIKLELEKQEVKEGNEVNENRFINLVYVKREEALNKVSLKQEQAEQKYAIMEIKKEKIAIIKAKYLIKESKTKDEEEKAKEILKAAKKRLREVETMKKKLDKDKSVGENEAKTMYEIEREKAIKEAEENVKKAKANLEKIEAFLKIAGRKIEIERDKAQSCRKTFQACEVLLEWGNTVLVSLRMELDNAKMVLNIMNAEDKAEIKTSINKLKDAYKRETIMKEKVETKWKEAQQYSETSHLIMQIIKADEQQGTRSVKIKS